MENKKKKLIKVESRAKAPMRRRIGPVVEAVLGSGVADGFAGNRRREGGRARSRRLPHNYKHTAVRITLPKQPLHVVRFLLERNGGCYHVAAAFWCHSGGF